MAKFIKKTFCLILLLQILFLCSSNGQIKETVFLRMHLNKGETYKYHIHSNTSMPGFYTTDINLDVNVHVDKIDSINRYALLLTIPHLKILNIADNQKPKVTINTDNELDTNLAKLKLIIRNLRIKCILQPNRGIESINIDEVLALVSEEMGTESGKINDEIKNEIKGEAMQKIFSSIAFPDQKLGVGDIWEIKPGEGKTIPNGLGAKYEIKSISGDRVAIGISQDTTSHKVNIGNSSILTTGTLNGSMILDLKTGLFISWKENSDFNIKTFEHSALDLEVKILSTLEIEKID